MDAGGPDADAAPFVDAAISPPNVALPRVDEPPLGAGYDDDAGTFDSVCLTGTVDYHFKSSGGVVGSSSNLDAAGLSRALAIASSGQTVGIDGQPAIAQFLSQAASDSASLNVMWPSDYESGYLAFNGSDLTKAPNATGCHHAYDAAETRLGARLIFGFKVAFPDAAAMESVTRRYNRDVNAWLDSPDAGWISVALARAQATITVEAMQLGGGDPSGLRAITDASRCSIGDLAACRATRDALQKYSLVTFTAPLGTNPTPADRGPWVAVATVLGSIPSFWQ